MPRPAGLGERATRAEEVGARMTIPFRALRRRSILGFQSAEIAAQPKISAD
jgi:hypothetical protein